MELSKKTTILFPPQMYDDLAALAEMRHSSVVELVRDACRRQYFQPRREELRAVVAQMVEMNLPVGNPEEMKRESMPGVEPLP